MGEIIVTADNEGIKSILRIKPGFFRSTLSFFLLICFNGHILNLVQSVIILGNEDNFIFSSSNLRNTYF